MGRADGTTGQRLLGALLAELDWSPSRLAEVVNVVPGTGYVARSTVSEWLHLDLYPANQDQELAFEGLQPDRLAERLIGRLALDSTRTSIVETVAGQVSGVQAVRWVTVCTRAAAHPVFTGRLSRTLNQWCARHPDTLTVAALQVATQVEKPGPLLQAAEQIATNTSTATAVLIRLESELPQHSHVPAEVAVALTEALVARHRQTLNTNPATDDSTWPGV